MMRQCSASIISHVISRALDPLYRKPKIWRSEKWGAHGKSGIGATVAPDNLNVDDCIFISQ
jgi:hypothetical protein